MAKTSAPPVRADGANVVSSRSETAKPSKKHVRSLRTTRAKGGGHVVEHEFDNSGAGPYHQAAQHVFGADEGVKHMKHYMRHAGVKGVSVAAAGDKDGNASGDDPDAGEDA